STATRLRFDPALLTQLDEREDIADFPTTQSVEVHAATAPSIFAPESLEASRDVRLTDRRDRDHHRARVAERRAPLHLAEPEARARDFLEDAILEIEWHFRGEESAQRGVHEERRADPGDLGDRVIGAQDLAVGAEQQE